jgi:branched-chain amino acid transport system ATP-binding protein
MTENGDSSNNMALLEIQDLTKDFGGLRAVNHCSFNVEEGTITALIGPNGAGKTTVFNLITGLLKPNEGRALFDGKNIVGLRPHRITRRGISRTFQITRDLMEMTVLENMVVQSPTTGLRGLFAGGILQQERQRAMELLDFVGIAHLADEKAKKLSYGQKKLMEFASVLMSEPRLIMLDEPAGGVNPALLEKIVDRIRRLNGDGITFLIVEHNMDVVMNLSHSVVVMAHGEVLTQDTPEAVRRNPIVLDAYLGEA